MTKEQAPRGSVYLHCSNIFTGANVRVRKKKSVRKLLERNKHSFRALTDEYDLGTICNVAKELLDAGVFESTSKAQAQFPELFQSSDGNGKESESSDFEATRSEADVREAMMSSEEENTKRPDLLYPKISPCGKSNLRRPMVVLGPTIGPRILNLPPATPRTPTLHPLTLPYKTQHHLLTTIQAVLEECCFDFGRLWLPEVLKAMSCECVESIELTRWTRILVRYYQKLPSWAINETPGVSFRDVLFKTHSIRHTAVHRRLISVCEIEKMIESAASLFGEFEEFDADGVFGNIVENEETITV